jgi:hypothetical protein
MDYTSPPPPFGAFFGPFRATGPSPKAAGPRPTWVWPCQAGLQFSATTRRHRRLEEASRKGSSRSSPLDQALALGYHCRPMKPGEAAAPSSFLLDRRTFISGITFGLFAAPLAAETQQAKAPRVGLLGLGSAESSTFFEALRQGLRERGWVEGQNIAFEDRTRVGHSSRMPDVAAELVQLRVDVIVAWGTTTALAARKATGTIPIVTAAGSPVEWDSPPAWRGQAATSPA